MVHSRYSVLDTFSPVTINFTYGVIVFSLFLVGPYFISLETTSVILLYWISFFLGCFSCNLFVFKGRIFDSRRSVYTHIFPGWVVCVLLLTNLLAIWGVVGYLKSLSVYGFFDIINNIEEVRRGLATGEASPSLIYRLLNKFNFFIPVSVFVCTLNYLYRRSFSSKVFLMVALAMAFIYSALLFQRSLFLLYFMFFAIPVLYLSYIKSRHLFIIKLITIFFLFVIGIWMITSIRSYEESIGFFEYFYRYVFGGFLGLDAFLYGSDSEVNLLEVQNNYINERGFSFYDIELGINTFKEFSWIYPLFDIPVPSRHGEYIYIPIMTNIYTIIRPFYQDFGVFGVFFLSFIFGAFSNYIYVALIKTGSYIYLYVYVLVLYSLVRQFSGFSFYFMFMFFGLFFFFLMSKILGGRHENFL